MAGLRQLPGGASRETWAFEAMLAGEPQPRRLVLRRDPGPTSVDSDRAHEFQILRAARASGVPVPEVYWLGDDPEALGARFFIMEYVAGETLARRLLRDAEYQHARGVMTAQLGAILARIHALDTTVQGLDFLAAPRAGRGAAQTEVERYEQLFAAYEQAGGGADDPAAVHFWELFGNMKWAVICIAQARTFLDGGVASLELASLGRRTAEVEHELMRLID